MKHIVTAAWPYVNTIPHLGNMIGSLLSADVIARYLRLKGEDVVFVTGSDMHGSPIEVEAIKQGVTPKEIAERNHRQLVDLFKKWRISTDNYTSTESTTHIKFVQEFYRKVYENGYVFTSEEELLYCAKDELFLPDRFVRGTCPHCGFPDAKGDQCDSCGAALTPVELESPRCAICDSTPIRRKTKHWFFDLPKLADAVREVIERSQTLSENAKSFTLSILGAGLKPRALTRDSKWGIKAPFPGAEGKTIYVWMEAVLGYISAVKELFEKRGEPEKWKDYWLDPNTRVYFFIGKDNIPFHTIIFPALLLASGGGYTLNFIVSATEFLLMEGQKFSKSRRIGVWIDEALDLLPADYWRFYLLSIRPEVKDTSFTWSSFEEKVNSDLNDAIGNFVHRVLALARRICGGIVGKPSAISPESEEMIEQVRASHREVTEHLDNCRIQRALTAVVTLAHRCNEYLNRMEPWRVYKTDRERAVDAMYTSLYAIRALGIMLCPFIPDSAEKILRYIGAWKRDLRWTDAVAPPPARWVVASDFSPLFRKVSAVELRAKLGR